MTNVNQDNQNSEGSSEAGSNSAAKLPLRGLAMILIAVAVLLALWGLYSMTRDDSPDTASGLVEESDLISTTQDATSTSSVDEGPDSSEPAQTTSPEAEESEDPADKADKDEDADRPTPGERKPAEPAESTGAGGAAGQATTAPARLNILNNSTVPNLAAEVAATLDDDGYELGEVGNLATQVLPENTVYFQPGNKDAEQRARELADKVDGVAREYDSQLPAETDGSNDITLVLVRQIAL